MTEIWEPAPDIPSPALPEPRLRKLGRRPLTVVMVHGSWHDEKTFGGLSARLNEEGVDTLAVRLQTELPYRSFDHYANTAATQMRKKRVGRAILLGASLGGDIIPRIVERVPDIDIEEMVFESVPFHPSTLYSFGLDKVAHHEEIQRNTELFEAGIMPLKYWNRALLVPGHSWGLTRFSPELAPQVFHNQSPAEVAADESANLRVQWRSNEQPVLERWPFEIPSTVIYGRHDQAVTEPWCRHQAESVLGVELQILDKADHSAHISAVDDVAELILSKVGHH